MTHTQWLRIPIERLLVARLRRELKGLPTPAHLGLIMDGNRRWARSVGVDDIRFGHRAGAEHLDRVLTWCAQAGVDAVSVYVLSADNIAKRDDAQVNFLFHLLETLILDRLRRPDGAWELHVAGNLDLVPDATAAANVGCPATSPGGRFVPSSSSATSTGRDFASWTCYARCAPTPGAGPAADEVSAGFELSDPRACVRHTGHPGDFSV